MSLSSIWAWGWMDVSWWIQQHQTLCGPVNAFTGRGGPTPVWPAELGCDSWRNSVMGMTGELGQRRIHVSLNIAFHPLKILLLLWSVNPRCYKSIFPDTAVLSCCAFSTKLLDYCSPSGLQFSFSFFFIALSISSMCYMAETHSCLPYPSERCPTRQPSHQAVVEERNAGFFSRKLVNMNFLLTRAVNLQIGSASGRRGR